MSHSSRTPGPPALLWRLATCGAAGLAVAGLAARVVPSSTARLDEARRLGIVSRTTLDGYDPGRDLRAYALALVAGLLASAGLWLLWVRRREPVSGAPDLGPVRPWTWREAAVVSLVLLPGLLRFDVAINGWDAHYTFFAEEGQVLSWAQATLDGGLLGRDAYCPYGPLAVLPFAAAFALVRPSVLLWRLGFYLLDLPALVAGYLVLRELTRTRRAAAAGLLLLTFHRMWPMPGISWSLWRVGAGLAALAAVARFGRRPSFLPLACAGAFLAAALLFSPEAGLAATLSCATGLAVLGLRNGLPRGVVRALPAIGAGAAVVAVPVASWFALRGGLGALLVDLYGFSRLRTLGHGALPFPDLPGRLAGWLASPKEAAWEPLRESVAAVFAPALIVVASFDVVRRLPRGGRDPVVALEAGLAVYGAVLFVSPLSRADLTHLLFAMPPVFILATAFVERAALRLRAGGPLADRAVALAMALVLLSGLAAFDTDPLDDIGIFARQVAANLTGRGYGPAGDGMRRLDLPRAGGVRLPAERADEVEQVVRHLDRSTAPGEPVWCFPAEPMLNFLADRPLPSRYAVGLFAITRKQREELLDDVVRRRVRRIVVNTKPIIVDGIPSKDALPELWSFVDSRYEPEAVFGRFVVMRPRDPDGSDGAPR